MVEFKARSQEAMRWVASQHFKWSRAHIDLRTPLSTQKPTLGFLCFSLQCKSVVLEWRTHTKSCTPVTHVAWKHALCTSVERWPLCLLSPPPHPYEGDWCIAIAWGMSSRLEIWGFEKILDLYLHSSQSKGFWPYPLIARHPRSNLAGSTLFWRHSVASTQTFPCLRGMQLCYGVSSSHMVQQ